MKIKNENIRVLIPPPIVGYLIVYLKSGKEIDYLDCQYLNNAEELYLKSNNGYIVHIPKENVEYYEFRPKE